MYMFISGLIVVSIVCIFVFAMFFVMRSKSKGKLLAIFIEADRSVSFRMFKPKAKLFTLSKRKEDGETYRINTEKVMLIQYPLFGPSVIKQTVPCLIYSRNNPEPLDPSEVMIAPKALTAKQVFSVLDDNIVRDIVKATGAMAKKDKVPAWLVAAVCCVLVLITMVLVFMTRADVNSLKNMIGN